MNCEEGEAAVGNRGKREGRELDVSPRRCLDEKWNISDG